MKTGLIYATKTGHSTKIAKAIARELRVDALNIKNNPQIEDLDVLYIVGGIYGGKDAPELIAYANNMKAGQAERVALITSSAGNSQRQSALREILTGKGIVVVEEEFMCQGSFLFVGMGHPNQQDIQNAVDFARRIAKRG